MAHTERTQRDDHRPHPVLYVKGQTVGMMAANGLATATITHTDAGGWIYADDWYYADGSSCDDCPYYFRSTQVILMPDKAVV